MRSLMELLRAAAATAWAALLAVLSGHRLDHWGDTEEEARRRLGADAVMPNPDVRFVRVITVDAPPRAVWPWVAQIGRGAGYYSYDVLDNGGRPSAEHLLDIPPPALGDWNDQIGEVVAVEPGREIVWLTPPARFLGANARMALGYTVLPGEGSSSRVVTLILARVEGRTARLAERVFAVIDYVMATEQLRGLKRRVEGGSELGGRCACAGAASHQDTRVAYRHSRER